MEDINDYAKNLQYNNNFTAFVRKATASGFNPEIGLFWLLPEKNNKVVGEKILTQYTFPYKSTRKQVSF